MKPSTSRPSRAISSFACSCTTWPYSCSVTLMSEQSWLIDSHAMLAHLSAWPTAVEVCYKACKISFTCSDNGAVVALNWAYSLSKWWLREGAVTCFRPHTTRLVPISTCKTVVPYGKYWSWGEIDLWINNASWLLDASLCFALCVWAQSHCRPTLCHSYRLLLRVTIFYVFCLPLKFSFMMQKRQNFNQQPPTLFVTSQSASVVVHNTL